MGPGLLRPENNADFLRQCLLHFPEVNFADQATGRIYLRFASGAPVWSDSDALARAIADPEAYAGLMAASPSALSRALASTGGPVFLGEVSAGERWVTVGAWGASRA